ncbi:hypothetical protein RN001_002311 [Aquatica leii]|uniref:Nucleolar protein 9 n=1 Tax=Aquatica leii TaxID=1421715 RepID=A0AAN7QB16_9COLE|nr:hypothetical protein RN001_002311 [Aquatica leii]
MSDSQEQVRYKRKRKKSFLKNAKGYGKKGMYGRGTQLDADTYQYFIRILEVYKEGFPSEEDKLIFVNNVFQHTEDQEINCCCNQVGCRVIQTFLPFANDTYLKRYMDILLSDLRPLCSDPFASHVIQTLLDIACQKSFEKDIEKDFRESCKTATIRISKFLLNNLEDYVWDSYGNHIIRTVLKNLTCLKNDSHVSIDEYKSIVREFGNRLISWPQFNSLPYSELTSGLLQILLNALAVIDPKLLGSYLTKFLNESFTKISQTEYENTSTDTLPDAFMSKPVIMLLECCLEVATPKLYTQIYIQCFANKLLRLSKIKNTNFAVQKLLNQCKEKSEFESMFDELSGSLNEIIDVGHTGVILALGQGCKRLSTKQGVFVQNIMKYYDCYEPEAHQIDIVMCLCKNLKHSLLKENKDVDLQNARLNLHGTLIVQLLLEFNKPIKIINSILGIDLNNLKKIFCNRMGCHIVDAFVKSQYVGEKSREKLIRKLQGTYQDLASDKYGSRSFEAIWNVANLKSRKIIMNELAHKDGVWSNSQFGKIISSKISLQLYKRNKDDWTKCVDKKDSKVNAKELFVDIIG